MTESAYRDGHMPVALKRSDAEAEASGTAKPQRVFNHEILERHEKES
jgi:hypothetical protein